LSHSCKSGSGGVEEGRRENVVGGGENMLNINLKELPGQHTELDKECHREYYVVLIPKITKPRRSGMNVK
jgi:hypothetical protein